MSAHLPSAATSFIDSRRVGAATVTAVSDGELLWEPRFPAPEAEWRQILPDADDKGRIWIGLNACFIRMGDALVLVDPGCDDPGSAWERNLVNVWPDWPVTRTPGLAAAMDRLGIDPGQVTHVVITHPHGDHYAGVARERDGVLEPRFPNARHFLGRADWEGNPNRGQPGSALARLELVDQLGLLELVDRAREIVPGVAMIPAPGESAGHCVVRGESRGEVFYNLGDLVHHACEVAHAAWLPPHADGAALLAARERIYREAAREHALLVTAHERFPPWGKIVAVDGGYRWVRG